MSPGVGIGGEREAGSSAPLLVALVVAVARNGVIGRGNTLPWHLPADLRHFKALTIGKPILMGRKTHESIGRPLPGRENLVLTRDSSWRAEGVYAVHSVEEAVQRAGHSSTALMVIGGAEIYRLTLPLAHRVYLTQVLADVEGDTLFPSLDPREWCDVEHSEHAADERNAYPMRFLTLERRTVAGSAVAGV